MKNKLLLLALPLLCSCGKNDPNYKDQFYALLEKSYTESYVVTVEFSMTEAKTFNYEYIVADVYHSDGDLHKDSYLIIVDNNGNIVEIGEIK